MKRVFGAIAACLISTNAMADETAYFDSTRMPFIDSEHSAFMSAIYTLDTVCTQSDNFVLDEMCEDIGDVVAQDSDCLDVNEPENLGTNLAGCQVTIANRLAAEIQIIFNEYSISNYREQKSGNDYQIYDVEGQKFAIRLNPI